MFNIRTNNRKAISAVLTTIIILVASIVLGTGVVVFSTGLFQTGGQQQAVQVVGLKAWVSSNNTNGYSWGAFALKNTGDKLLSVSSITLRGATVPFSNWYADTNSTQVSANFQSQFISTGIAGSTGNMQSNVSYAAASTTCPTQQIVNGLPNEITINEAGQPDTIPVAYSPTMLCLKQAAGPTALNPGAQMIVYYRIPNSILTQVDSGSSVTANIFAGNVGGPTTVSIGTS